VERLNDGRVEGLAVTRHVNNTVPAPYHQRLGNFSGPVNRRFAYEFLLPGILLLHAHVKPAANAENDMTGALQFDSCQALTPVKTMTRIDITRKSTQLGSAVWRFEFEASAFLHHMIRNLMGCFVQIGQGLQPADWMADVLAAKNRDAAAPTFSPDGLYFLGPVYEDHWGLPTRTPAYDWLP